MIHVEGHSVEDVRKLTGWSTPLVKVRAFRARHRLKTIFEKLMTEGKL